MSESLSQAEQDLLGQMARFAEKRSVNGVYLMTCNSKSIGAPVLILCAIGEQALAVNQLLMGNAVNDALITPGTAAAKFTNGHE